MALTDEEMVEILAKFDELITKAEGTALLDDIKALKRKLKKEDKDVEKKE